MKLTFAGASHEVTGSNFLLETNGSRFLVDCGMFQGGDDHDQKNQDDFLYDPKSVDAVLVTHAHFDHVGRIPKLVHEGFAGVIYMTTGTKELAKLIWEDAYRIMRYNHERYGKPMLYEEGDVERAYELSRGVQYGAEVEVAPNARAVWKDAGHIFGSAFIELSVDGKKIAFSGDLGNVNAPILRDTENLSADVDVLLCESTYGDRSHEGEASGAELLQQYVREGVEKGGAIMMPAFSLERTQEILYRINKMVEDDKTFPHVPIYLDSPLAIRATEVYRDLPEYYDADAAARYKAGDDFLDFPGLTVTLSKEESKQINDAPMPKMIIAGSGMMSGGRIMHHAKRYLSDPNATLILVGYQAEGTVGRKIVDGQKTVKIHGEEIEVHATVKKIEVFSAHADQKKLLEWIGSGGVAPKQVFCVHGEVHSAEALAEKVRERYGVGTDVPQYAQQVEI